MLIKNNKKKSLLKTFLGLKQIICLKQFYETIKCITNIKILYWEKAK